MLARLGRYALAWAVVGWTCWWLADARMCAAGFAIAAMVANPWRPKISRPRGVDAATAVGRGPGAERSARYRAMPARRLLSALDRRRLPVATGSS